MRLSGIEYTVKSELSSIFSLSVLLKKFLSVRRNVSCKFKKTPMKIVVQDIVTKDSHYMKPYSFFILTPSHRFLLLSWIYSESEEFSIFESDTSRM